MKNIEKVPNILAGKIQQGTYPMEKVKRVDEITTNIVGEIQRTDVRKTGFALAASGAFGTTAQREFRRHGPKFPIAAAMIDDIGPVFNQVADGPVAPNKAPLPSNMVVLSRHLKSLGYFLGADVAGICQLPQWAIYSHTREGKPIDLTHQYAIVYGVDMDYETMRGSTGHDWISTSESFHAYNASAHIACTVASYIRKLGYSARAHFMGGIANYLVTVSPLAILAGIGELSRAGWALNPFIGGRWKGAAVTTDLPLAVDKPIDFGLQKFCRICKQCALECPSKAISTADEKIGFNGYMRWGFDFERCTKYRVTNQNGSSCGVCVKVCPWNKPRGWTHDTVRWFAENIPFLHGFLVNMDNVFGYGKQDIRYKWWLDLETVDGVMRIPPKSRENTLWQLQERPAPPPQMPK